MGFSIGGLSSGIDTASLVASLMQAERIPQQKLKTQQQASLKAVASWNDLRTKMQAIQAAGEALQTPAKALGSTATSSDDKAVRATATAGAAPAVYSVKVEQLATVQQRVKDDVGPLSMTVGAGRTELSASSSGLRRADGTSLVSFAGAAQGVRKVEVTRASAPAAVYGALVVPTSPTELTVDVDGSGPQTVSLSGNYAGDPAAFLKELNDGFALAGTAVRATVVGGRLQLATAGEGALRTLSVSGPAASAFGLPAAQAKGQSALVAVDGTTLEVEPGGTAPYALGTSGISLDVRGGLRTGRSTANVVVTTDTTTLGDLQHLLNATGSPVSAAVVAGATGNSLVLNSTTSGADGAVDVPADVPLSVLRAFDSTTPPKNAVALVNGIRIERSANTLTDVLPGLSLDLQSKPADGLERTVTVARDSSGTADRVKALVEAMNSFISKVGVDTKYDVKAKSGGPLVGDSAARALSASLFSKASSVVGTAGLRSHSQLGIETTREGRFELKGDNLTKALASDPDAVAKVLAEFGDSIAGFARSTAQTGAVLTTRRDGAQSDADNRQKQSDALETRLTAIEKRYKATYAAMETALASLKSQGGALSAALSSVSNGS